MPVLLPEDAWLLNLPTAENPEQLGLFGWGPAVKTGSTRTPLRSAVPPQSSADLPWGGREPREWQVRALPKALAAIRAGKRGVVSAVMGSGKSWCLLEICANVAGDIIITVPTVHLVDQMAYAALTRFGEGAVVGRYLLGQADRDELAEACRRAGIGRYYTHAKEADARITICCLPSLPSLLEAREGRQVDLWIADECFVAGTLVGGKPIESIQTGDVIPAFNEVTGEIEKCVVTAIMKRSPSALVRLCASGLEVVCTPEHPFWTERGWRPAIDCGGVNVMLCTEPHVMCGEVHDGQQHKAASSGALRMVWSNLRCGFAQAATAMAAGADVLRRRVCEREEERVDQQRLDGHQAPVQPRTDASRQSDVGPRGQREGPDLLAGHGLEASGSRRQRETPACAADACGLNAGVADGGADSNWLWQGQRVPDVLQSGHRELSAEGGDRGGRQESCLASRASERQEEGRLLAWARVDRVEVLESGSDGRYGGLCPDGLVYNLEVADVHTYIANGFVVHNCHKTECATVLQAHETLAPKAAIGFTATPFRALETEELSLWQELVEEYDASKAWDDSIRAVEEGHPERRVIVRPEVVPWDGGEVSVDLACADLIARKTAGPGLANAISIEDAEEFADYLSRRGIRAKAVHSRQSRELQRETMRELRDGVNDLRCVVHVNMLSEGVDFPWLRWLCMRRPVGSRVRFCQEVGRVLRAAPGKDKAWLLDPHDLFDKFALTWQAVLAGQAAPKEEKLPEDAEADDLLDALDEQGRALPLKPGQKAVEPIKLIRRYVRTLYLTFLSAGIVEEKVKSTHWRGFTPSEKQAWFADSMLGNLQRETGIPPQHRKALRVVQSSMGDLKRGDMSDLITIAKCLEQRRGKWGHRREAMVWPELHPKIAAEAEAVEAA